MTEVATQPIAGSGFPELGTPGLRDTMRGGVDKTENAALDASDDRHRRNSRDRPFCTAVASDRVQPIKRAQARHAPERP